MIQKLVRGYASTLIADDGVVRIPPGIDSLEVFRRWLYSEDVPESGRICFLNGEVWVDMSKEQFFSHNQVKQEFSQVLGPMAKRRRLGRYIPDGMLFTNELANLACRPDGAFVSLESLRSSLARLVEGKEEGFLEIEGTLDMVLEIVSASSV